jgi:hypothetical protein
MQEEYVPITANDATPLITDPATGARMWNNQQDNTEKLSSMATRKMNTEYGKLTTIITGGYMGEPVSTVPEDCLVNAKQGIYIPNPERACIGIKADNTPELGYYGINEIKSFKFAFGAGPIVLIPGEERIPKVADPSLPVGNQTPDTIWFNPHNEYFANQDTRISLYSNKSPQTMCAIGRVSPSLPFIVFAASNGGITGFNLAQELRKMGASHAILLDGDSQTGLLHYGPNQSFQGFEQDPVPVAIATYKKLN